MKRALNNTNLIKVRCPDNNGLCDKCLLHKFPLSACMLVYCPVNEIFVDANYLSDIFKL